MNLLKSTITMTTLLISIFIIMGAIIGKINLKTNSYLYSLFGKTGIRIAGFIGVPVHELSHYLLAKLFNHRVIDMKLYRPIAGEYDGVLGYVNHSYNKKSLYQKIGNFFIGIAPIIIGSLIVMLSFNLLLPEIANIITSSININYYLNQPNNISIMSLLNLCTANFFKIIYIFISNISITNIRFWIFLFISFSIISNMSLSKNDLEGCYSGIISIFLGVFVLNIMILALGIDYNIFNLFLIKLNIIFTFLLSFIILLSFIDLTIIYIFYKLRF